MKAYLLFMIALVIISGFITSGVARSQVDEGQIEKLIQDLGSSDFQTRERAESALKKIGEPAAPSLRKAAADEDLERATRAKRILDAVGREGKTTPGAREEDGLTLTDAESVKISFSDGKIVVEITRNGKTETYEAESAGDFKKKYPEIAKKYSLGIEIIPRELDDPFEEFDALKRLLDDRLDDDMFRDLERMLRELRETPLRQPAPRIEKTVPKRVPSMKHRFGVRVIPCSAAMREQLKLAEDEGVVVTEVTPGSAAERCGLKEDDIILNVNGRSTGDITQFADDIRDAMEAPRVELNIMRKGERQTLSSTTEEEK